MTVHRGMFPVTFTLSRQHAPDGRTNGSKQQFTIEEREREGVDQREEHRLWCELRV